MSVKRAAWQIALINAITDPQELIELLELDLSLLGPAQKSSLLFPLKVPRPFVSLINKGDADDPLLRQVLPLAAESDLNQGFVQDPLEESKFNPTPGLLHKYKDRVLLTVTGNCGINCRYCFRRHFPYDKNQLGPSKRKAILEYIAKDRDINEVILSGGDPLTVSDSLLQSWIKDLAEISHLKRLRIHTRLPVMLPGRITEELVSILSTSRLQPIVVLHCNHPREISNCFVKKMRLLQRAGVTLLNQSVLLAGVNDSAAVLIELSEALFSADVLPYYLHLPDKVAGTKHFDVAIKRALDIYESVRASLSGFLVPRLVRELSGDTAKKLIVP